MSRIPDKVRKAEQQIRQLRPGDHVPTSSPKRYLSSHGYVRLRWLVGTAEYVETYEHRVFDGVVTDAEHVHHLNGVKTDNRPENLRPMTAEEHNHHHGSQHTRRWAPYRSNAAMLKAAYEANRRFDVARRTERMREMSDAGMTTIQIGEALGIHCSAVSRYLTRGRNW